MFQNRNETYEDKQALSLTMPIELRTHGRTTNPTKSHSVRLRKAVCRSIPQRLHARSILLIFHCFLFVFFEIHDGTRVSMLSNVSRSSPANATNRHRKFDHLESRYGREVSIELKSARTKSFREHSCDESARKVKTQSLDMRSGCCFQLIESCPVLRRSVHRFFSTVPRKSFSDMSQFSKALHCFPSLKLKYFIGFALHHEQK